MTADEMIRLLQVPDPSPRNKGAAPFWVRQAALIAVPSRFGRPYETTAARFFREVTVRILTQKKAKRTGKVYEGLQRRRMDLVALIQPNMYQYQPIIAGVEIKVDAHDLANDSKTPDYLEYCHLFYLAVPEELKVLALQKLASLAGVGLLLIGEAVRVERQPRLYQPDDTHLKEIFAELLIKPIKIERG